MEEMQFSAVVSVTLNGTGFITKYILKHCMCTVPWCIHTEHACGDVFDPNSGVNGCGGHQGCT